MDTILSGKAYWSYDYELMERDTSADIFFSMNSIIFHKHSGKIVLTNESLTITGEDGLKVALDDITQIYLGFDDVFPSSLVRGAGLFWQPLRISLRNRQVFYLVIDYNFFDSNNHRWFNALKEILSE